MDYVAGYTVVHDVSARDWQLKKNSGQWLIGKTFDSFCPIGPAIVTKDSLSGSQLGYSLLNCSNLTLRYYFFAKDLLFFFFNSF